MNNEYPDTAAKELINKLLEMQSEKVFMLMYLQENEMLQDFTRWSESMANRINIQTDDKTDL